MKTIDVIGWLHENEWDDMGGGLSKQKSQGFLKRHMSKFLKGLTNKVFGGLAWIGMKAYRAIELETIEHDENPWEPDSEEIALLKGMGWLLSDWVRNSVSVLDDDGVHLERLKTLIRAMLVEYVHPDELLSEYISVDEEREEIKWEA